MFQVEEFYDSRGRNSFGRWFNSLDVQAAIKVANAIERMRRGILSNSKAVGAGVLEYRIDSGPGYRIYYGRDGDTLIVLLGGGTKRGQQRDIEAARELWQEYLRRRQEK